MKKFIYNWLPPVLWAGFIFYLSSVPNLNSGFAAFWDVFLRKLAHAGEFGILNFLIFRAMRGYQISFKKSLIWSFVLTIIYSFSDEAHQRFVAERQAKIFDVFIDSLGILLASAAILFFNLSKKNKTPN